MYKSLYLLESQCGISTSFCIIYVLDAVMVYYNFVLCHQTMSGNILGSLSYDDLLQSRF